MVKEKVVVHTKWGNQMYPIKKLTRDIKWEKEVIDSSRQGVSIVFKNFYWVVNDESDKDQGVEVVVQGLTMLNQGHPASPNFF